METEKNEYELRNINEGGNPETSQKVVFFRKSPDGTSDQGTTLEELLRVGIERLSDLNSRFSCRENSIAITKMQEALMWLNERTRDREARGVEGKHLK